MRRREGLAEQEDLFGHRPPTFEELVSAVRALQPPQNEPRFASFEKHFGTFVATALLLLCGWVMYSIQGIEKSVVELRTTVGVMQQTVNQLPAQQTNMQVAIGSLERRIALIEQRLNLEVGGGGSRRNGQAGSGGSLLPDSLPPQ